MQKKENYLKINALKWILNTRKASYSSTLEKDRLIEKAKNLFDKETMNFKGKFTDKNKFVAYDRLNVVGWNMPNLRRKSAYLKGEITKAANGTMINLEVKPNSVLPIFAVTALFAGVAITTTELLSTDNDQSLLLFGLTLIILGIIYYPASLLLRNRLLNRVVKCLDLQEA